MIEQKIKTLQAAVSEPRDMAVSPDFRGAWPAGTCPIPATIPADGPTDDGAEDFALCQRAWEALQSRSDATDRLQHVEDEWGFEADSGDRRAEDRIIRAEESLERAERRVNTIADELDAAIQRRGLA